MINRTEKTIGMPSKAFKKSLLAMSIIALGTPVLAQTNSKADEQVEEVVVQGIRTSLENAQELKRAADTVKDVITASDIGALPDKSVTEALQRVPGVSISRFASPADPNHFAAEGRGVLVRGLDRVHSQFNGRESFSAGNWTSGLSYEDIPPELVGTVEVVKNQTSDIISGGIAGTVNLITRKPFDFDGQKVFFSAKNSYGDLVDDWSPSYSGLFSNRWDSELGEFGVLVSVSTSEFTARGDGIGLTNFYERSATQTEFPDLGSTELPGYEGQKLFMPSGVWLRTADSERDRNGFDTSFQWQNTDETIRATAEFIRSDSEETWRERVLLPTVSSQGFEPDFINATLATGTPATFDENGYFTSGTITSPWNLAYLTSSRGDRVHSVVDDASFNLLLTPDDKWKIELDYQTLDTTYERENNTINNRFANSDIFLDLRGEVPEVEFLGTNATGNPPDWLGCPVGTNPDTTDLSNPAGSCQYYQVSIMDTNIDAVGEMDAFTADVEYQIDSGWFKSVSGGAYFSEIDRTTQDDDYINWGAVSHTWGELPKSGLAEHPELYEPVTFGNDFFGGKALAGDNRTFLFPRMSNTQEKNLLVYDTFLTVNQINNGGWHNRSTRRAIDGTLADVKGYLPHETVKTAVDRQEAYIRLDLANEDLAMPVKANLGLRYVSYDVEATGSSRFNPASLGAGSPAEVYYLANYPEHAAFFNGNASTQSTAKPETYTTTLPSLNVSLGITEDLITRLAFSKAIFFPSFYDIRNTKNYIPTVNTTTDSGGAVVSQSVSQSATGGNPYLKPEESDQVDLTLEWYFNEGDSLTFSLFTKDVSNLFRERNVDITAVNPSNGAELDMTTRHMVNEGEGKIEGFEIAYQQFFDSLPGAWSGLGTQINYTYISQEDLDDVDAGQNTSVGGVRNTFRNFANLPLPGLSEDTYNFVLMYQYSDIEARIAYNWRSDYLVTRRDADGFAPIFFESQGYMDASIWYTVNDSIRIGIEGANLLNELTKTQTMVNNEGFVAGKNYSFTDKRYAVSMRLTF